MDPTPTARRRRRRRVAEENRKRDHERESLKRNAIDSELMISPLS
ncbi:hypothetical protein H9Q71_014522, partial [Fusarium xylarioides]